MNQSQLVLLIVGAAVGALIILVSFTVDFTPRMTKPIRSKKDAKPLLTRQQMLWGAAGLSLGIILFIISGWLLLLFIWPIAGIFLPDLLSKGDGPQRIARLDALETWTRSLAGLIFGSSIGLEQTLTASLQSAPDEIKPQVTALVARLNARWPTRDALEAFAADFDDPTADLIVMHLLLKERASGPGLATALEDLAEIIFEEVRVRRSIETDRAKPRTQIRIVTIALLVILAGLPFFGSYTAAYASFLGQALLAFWLALFAGLLYWMRSISKGRSAPRLLVAPTITEGAAA